MNGITWEANCLLTGNHPKWLDTFGLAGWYCNHPSWAQAQTQLVLFSVLAIVFLLLVFFLVKRLLK